MKLPDHQDFVAAQARAVPPPIPVGGLSQLERNAVLASITDGAASLRDPSLADKLTYAVFGASRETGLANERLEALRRYAVEWRLLGAADEDTLGRVRLAGFNETQLAEVRTLVGPARSRRKSPYSWLWLAALAGFVIWGFGQLRALLGDPIVSAIFLGLLAVQLVPLLFIAGQATQGAGRRQSRRGVA